MFHAPAGVQSVAYTDWHTVDGRKVFTSGAALPGGGGVASQTAMSRAAARAVSPYGESTSGRVTLKRHTLPALSRARSHGVANASRAIITVRRRVTHDGDSLQADPLDDSDEWMQAVYTQALIEAPRAEELHVVSIVADR
jgi:hypothetical protein